MRWKICWSETYPLSLALSPTQLTPIGDPMKRYLILTSLILSACNLSSVPPAVPAGPTAYIHPSHPTLGTAPETSRVTSGGIEVRAERAWRDGKQVNVD